MNRLLIILFYPSYFFYKVRYKIFSLRFNGYLIRISGKGEINVGANSYVSFYSALYLTKGTTLTIGSCVSIAHNVKIYTSTFDANKLYKYGTKIEKKGDVNIGDNVLIGTNSFVLPNVSICSDVVIGANSVVAKDISRPGVYAGNPLRLISD